MKKLLFYLLTPCLLIVSGNVLAQKSNTAVRQIVTGKTVVGKFYFTSKGKTFPAAYKQAVIMPNTESNLKLAQNQYNLFDDNVVVKIGGAKKFITDANGYYSVKNLAAGRYIIRVVGMGGMVIQFQVPNDATTSFKIPDMPAQYSKPIPKDIYVKG